MKMIIAHHVCATGCLRILFYFTFYFLLFHFAEIRSVKMIIAYHVCATGYRGSSSRQAALAACFDGWWWMVVVADGRAAKIEKKIMFFKNFSNTIRYFFLVVSRPLRRFFKTFSQKSSKK